MMTIIGQILYGVVLFLLITLALGALSAAPWVPTRKREQELLVGEVPLKPGAVVYDLGCGDGAILFALADAQPDIRAIGYDVALPPLFAGWIRIALGRGRYRGVSLRWGDFFAKPVNDADAVLVFLMPRAQEKVRAKLAREIRDDAIVVCEAWPLEGVAYERKIGGAAGVLSMYIYRGAALRMMTA